jgi:branched-chain amino acid transport system ATP-binding protein
LATEAPTPGPARSEASPPRLDVSGLSVNYGLHRVLDECSLSVAPREIVALVGHNGAGKTTLLRAVLGLVAPGAGSVSFGGQDLAKTTTAQRARMGLALVPDVARGGIFPALDVRDNLALAEDVASRDGGHVPDALLRELFPVIFEKERQPVGELSGGQRQMVAIALALKRNPRMLLLDEPSVGLAPVVVQEVMAAIERVVRELGIGTLLVEQNVRAAMKVADRLDVLKSGRLITSLAPDEVADVHALWSYF